MVQFTEENRRQFWFGRRIIFQIPKNDFHSKLLYVVDFRHICGRTTDAALQPKERDVGNYRFSLGRYFYSIRKYTKLPIYIYKKIFIIYFFLVDCFIFQGYFTTTPLYYGFYTNHTIDFLFVSYSMPQAYFFTMGAIYLVYLVFFSLRFVFSFFFLQFLFQALMNNVIFLVIFIIF